MKIIGVLIASLVLAGAAAGAAGNGGAVVKTAYNKKLKTTILVDARGMTLYMFASDYKTVSACTDDPSYHCSKHWPPLLTTGDPVASGGARQSLLGTAQRADGTTQVTYAGHLLYTYKLSYGGAADKKPGDIAGQGFYSSWYVLAPSGALVKKH
jgi:predicted lipoprotein with Yx(FWY)xxD motif